MVIVWHAGSPKTTSRSISSVTVHASTSSCPRPSYRGRSSTTRPPRLSVAGGGGHVGRRAYASAAHVVGLCHLKPLDDAAGCCGLAVGGADAYSFSRLPTMALSARATGSPSLTKA